MIDWNLIRFGFKILGFKKFYLFLILSVFFLIFFINLLLKFYYQIYIEKLKGIFPNIYIESIKKPRISCCKVQLTREFLSLIKNKIQIKYKDDIISIKNISIRSFDENHIPFLIRRYKNEIESKKNIVFVTPLLYTRIAPYLDENWLNIVKNNKVIQVKVIPLQVMINECWVLIPNYMISKILDDVFLKKKTSWKWVIYCKNKNFLKKIINNYEVRTWKDLVPFYLHVLYLTGDKSFKIFTSLLIGILIFIIFALWHDIGYDFKHYIKFAFLFGIDKDKIILSLYLFLFIFSSFIIFFSNLIAFSLFFIFLSKSNFYFFIFRDLLYNLKYILGVILSFPLIRSFVNKNYLSPLEEVTEI